LIGYCDAFVEDDDISLQIMLHNWNMKRPSELMMW